MNFLHCVLTSPHSHRSEKTVTSDLCKPLDFTWPLQHSPARNREGFMLPLGESGSQASYQSMLICKATIFSVMLEPGERALCNVFPFSRRTFTRYFSQRHNLFLGLSVCLFHHFQVELWVTTCCLWPRLADSRISLPSCVFLFVSFACNLQHCREFRRAVVSLFICLTFWDKSLTMQP